MNIEISGVGFKKLVGAIDAAGDTMKTFTPIAAGIRRALKPMVKGMKNRERQFRRTGNLFRSYASWFDRKRRTIRVGARYSGKARFRAPHAHLIEFGHRTQKGGFTQGRNSIQRSWDENSRRFFNEAAEEVGRVVQKAVETGKGLK